MKPIGWILMLTSWVVIIGLFVYCLIRVMTTHRDNNG